jgi:hypothetical protein
MNKTVIKKTVYMTVISLKKHRLTVISAGREQTESDQLEGRHGAG